MIFQRHSLKLQKRKSMSKKIGRPKISEDIKKVIIKLHNSKLGVRKISNQLGIGKSSVHRVIKEIENNPTPLDLATTEATADVETTAPPIETKVKNIIQNKSSLFKNIPHSHQIDDAMIEQMKSELGYPNISYFKLLVGHQKKCRCFRCSIVRKKNWLQLKKWADINVTRNEDNA